MDYKEKYPWIEIASGRVSARRYQRVTGNEGPSPLMKLHLEERRLAKFQGRSDSGTRSLLGSENFWIAVTLVALLYIVVGTPIALANHQPSQYYGSGDVYLILFGMLAVGIASVVIYSAWNKRRKRRLRKAQRFSRRKRG